MKINKPILGSALLVGILVSGCKQANTAGDTLHQPTPPQYEAFIDRSTPPVQIDVEQAMKSSANLKLSEIASSLEYYRVGDANFPVMQAIEIPDSNAFITLNYPRIYYRKQHVPSKRYGFKALLYKWNKEMNGQNLFYDKKTSRVYCALSGLGQENKENPNPHIGELPPLDSMLNIKNYIFPESLVVRSSLLSAENKLLGFSSSGYTMYHYEGEAGEPNGVITFNAQGDTLCRFILKEPSCNATRVKTDSIPSFHTFYWNNAQDRMSFMIPFCDTVYQLQDAHTVTPLYAINLGEAAIGGDDLTNDTIATGKAWLRAFIENSKGLFIGLQKKGAPAIRNWLGWTDEYKPLLSHRIVYLKEEGRTYLLPILSGGFSNDIDDGLPFWPDGQTDNSLYMIRTVTEMRENVKRTGSARQQELIRFLDDSGVNERDFVMIVARVK